MLTLGKGCGKSDSFSLALQLSLSPSLTLTHSLTLTLSLSLLRSADSVQGTPAAGFWVRIYISLNIRQRGNRNTGRDRKRSHLSQMLADWSGGSLSKEFDQNKLARREPETRSVFGKPDEEPKFKPAKFLAADGMRTVK